MDYQLSDQEEQYRKDMEEFFQDRIGPRAAELDQGHGDKAAGIMRANLKAIAEQDFLRAGILENSIDLIKVYLAGEELSRACASTFLSARASAFMCGGALTLFGSTEQKKRYIPDIMRAENIGAIAYTEETAGTDISAISTITRRTNEGWVLSGKKHIVVNAPIADVFLVLAYSNRDAGAESGMSFFIVEKDTPGLKVGEPIKMMGMRGVPIASVELDNCLAVSVLGDEPGKGKHQIDKLMTMGCVGITAMCVGIGTACMELTTRHAKERTAFGRQIGKFQDVGFKLSDMFSFNDLGRMMGLRAALALNTNDNEANILAACAKLFAGEAVTKIVNWGMQVFAAHGYIEGSPIERLYRDARFGQLCEGTSEILREFIAQHELDRFQQV
jgi:butyryl-CoA dehydrogenase